jgi:DNA replication protein DnaC
MEGVVVRQFRRQLDALDFERMNLPREYWTAKINSVPESIRDIITRYLVHIDKMSERGAGLVLSGKPGVGKTGVASLVCKEARSRGYTVFFIPVWELREHVRSRTMFDDTTSILDRCKDVDVLVLDGLRSEDARDYSFGSRSLEELLVGRGARKKISILTSRLDLASFRTEFPGLLEATQGCMVYLTVEGPNLRQEQNEALKRTVLGNS